MKHYTDFRNRLRKIYGNLFKYIAVPEYQKRGVVHFHCLVWGLPAVDIFNEIPWNVWTKIGIKHPKVLQRFITFCHEHNFEPEQAVGLRGFQHQWARGFLDCVPTDGSPKLATYMSKYMSKAMSDTEYEKRKMLEKLLSNATFKNKFIVNYQFKSIYSVLANTPKNCDLPTLLGGLESNQN